MLIEKYLVITGRKNRYGWLDPKVKLVEREPKLGQDEIALKLKLELPKALFERPTIVAQMTIPEEAVPRATITPEITDNLEKIIKDATGLTMVVSVVEQVTEESK